MTHRIDVYRDTAGGWRWRIVARNGEIVADSAEAYTRRRDAKRAAANVVGNIRAAAALGILDRASDADTSEGGDDAA